MNLLNNLEKINFYCECRSLSKDLLLDNQYILGICYFLFNNLIIF